MKLVYAYIKRFRNIRNQEINFSDEWSFSFNNGSICIRRKDPNPLMEIFGDSLLKDVNIIVGKTGAGKTNILQMIGMDRWTRYDEDKDSSYVLIYMAYGKSDSFLVESFAGENALSNEAIIPPGLYKLTLNNDFTYTLEPDRTKEFKECIIINSFDRHSFASCPYEDIHQEGFHRQDEYLQRIISPFGKTNVGIACEWIKRYIDEFPLTSIKRKASLVFKSHNWAKGEPSVIDENILRKQYWTYRDRELFDKEFKQKNCNISNREKFLHDLLADYALYLREYLEAFMMEERLRDFERGISHRGNRPSNKPNPFHSPDHWGNGSTKNLLTRIEWLSMVIDFNSDENFYDGHGLVWQISDDIKDIFHILSEVPEDCFTIETCSIPICEIKLGKEEYLEQLFERMTGYRPDELGLFDRELLPYQITCLSSGEYQLAKVLGAIDEYCIRLKLSNPRNPDGYRPDFILLLDEPETYMHPDLARRFLFEMDKILQKNKGDSSIQIIMTTHSPFMLSDVTSSQITCLDYDEDGFCRVLTKREETFGANIHSIMAHDFFLQYTIGEFSRNSLAAMISKLKALKENPANIMEVSETLKLAGIISDNLNEGLLKRYFQQTINELNDSLEL